MKEILVLGGFMVIWITLNMWVLPWFGIQTCMSGSCRPVLNSRTHAPKEISPSETHPAKSPQEQANPVTQQNHRLTSPIPSIDQQPLTDGR